MFRKPGLQAIPLVFFVIGLITCGGNHHEITESTYGVDRVISNLPLDSIDYVHNPMSITASDSLVVITDFGNTRVVVCDTSFRWAAAVGKRGRGPGEFVAPSYATYKDRRLYVLDYRSSRVQIFNSALQYIKDIKVPLAQFYSTIAVDDFGTISFPAGSHSDSVIVYKPDNQRIVQRLSDTGVLAGEEENRASPGFILAVDPSGNLYTIYLDQPLVVKYNKQYNMVWQSRYDSYPPVRDFMQRRAEKMNKIRKASSHGSTGMLVCNDFDFHNNALYLLIPMHVGLIGLDTRTGKVVERIVFNTYADESSTAATPSDFCFVGDRIYFVNIVLDKIGIASRKPGSRSS